MAIRILPIKESSINQLLFICLNNPQNALESTSGRLITGRNFMANDYISPQERISIPPSYRSYKSTLKFNLAVEKIFKRIFRQI